MDSYSELLDQMNDLRKEWRRNNFTWLPGKLEEYNTLLAIRRDRVKFFYEEGRVYKGGMQSK